MLLARGSDQPDTVRGLIAKLKADPGKYSYGSAGNGTTNHLSGELFKKLAGVDVTHVPYRGTGPAMQDLLARRLAYLFGSFGPAAEYIKSGQMRALAVCSAKRSAVAPDVPTMAEAGVPNFESATWNVVVAPAGTPPAVVERLNRAVNEVVKAPAMADACARSTWNRRTISRPPPPRPSSRPRSRSGAPSSNSPARGSIKFFHLPVFLLSPARGEGG